MKKLKLILFYFVAFNASLLFTGCTLSDDIATITESLDSLKVMIGTPQFKTSVLFEFVDAKTNEPISDLDINVSVSGRDAAFVYNNLGSKQESYTAFWGMLNLVIDPHKVDIDKMKTDPVQFEINVDAPGYISHSETVAIYDTIRNQIVIPLKNINNLPEGEEMHSNNNVATISESGIINEDIFVNFESAGSISSGKMNVLAVRNYTTVALSIPKGTILLGRNGETLTGRLSVSTNYSKFPLNGNYTTTLKSYISPSFKQLSWFQDYGYLSWDMYVGSKEVYGFKNGIVTSILYLPSGFINPETKQPIKENDIVKRLAWKQLTAKDERIDFVVQSKVQKDLIIIDTLKNQDPNININNWYFRWGHHEATCPNRIKFEFTGDDMYNASGIRFKHKIFKNNQLIHGNIGGIYYLRNGHIHIDELPNLPEGSTVHVFEDYIANKDYNLVFTPSQITIDNSCEDKVYKVSVRDVPKPGVEYTTINLSISLTNGPVIIKPNMYFIYQAISEKYPTRSFELIKGIGSFKIKVGEKHIVRYLGSIKTEAVVLIEIENATTYKITVTPFAFGSSTGGSPYIERKPRTADRSVDIDFTAKVNDATLNIFK